MSFAKFADTLRMAKYVLYKEGMFSFVCKGFSFLQSYIFSYNVNYLYEKTLIGTRDFKFMPRIENVKLKIVRSLKEFEELIVDGYNFESLVSREWIDVGAIPFCAFVDKELAHVTWVATNEESKKRIDSNPFKVNFQNSEVCSGASRTNPKYYRKGLYLYVYSKIFQFLEKEGKTKDIFTIGKANMASQKALAKFNPIMLRELRCLKILFWNYSKEIQL